MFLRVSPVERLSVWKNFSLFHSILLEGALAAQRPFFLLFFVETAETLFSAVTELADAGRTGEASTGPKISCILQCGRELEPEPLVP